MGDTILDNEESELWQRLNDVRIDYNKLKGERLTLNLSQVIRVSVNWFSHDQQLFLTCLHIVFCIANSNLFSFGGTNESLILMENWGLFSIGDTNAVFEVKIMSLPSVNCVNIVTTVTFTAILLIVAKKSQNHCHSCGFIIYFL